MTNAQSAEFQQAGKPVAQPTYLVDNTGAPISSTNPLSSSVSLTATSVAIEDGTTATQKLAVDASGRITVANLVQFGGQAPTLDNTSIQAVSMRGKGAGTAGDTALLLDAQGGLISGRATTATKSNVASSASSTTILASNTARKGALVYNDSTQVLYLDLSGGTASSSSYSVQIPSNGYFEVPGPTLYNGAITGIWASANGNARVTEIT